MIKEKLPIHKQYLVISAPTSFRLVANNGTDFVERPAGIWQLDCYKLLPEKFMKNYPVFNLELEYDETKIEEGFNFTYYFTNINLGDSLKGVSGDLVELSEYQFSILKSYLSSSPLEIKSLKIDTVLFSAKGETLRQDKFVTGLNFYANNKGCLALLGLKNNKIVKVHDWDFFNFSSPVLVYIPNLNYIYDSERDRISFFTVQGSDLLRTIRFATFDNRFELGSGYVTLINNNDTFGGFHTYLEDKLILNENQRLFNMTIPSDTIDEIQLVYLSLEK